MHVWYPDRCSSVERCARDTAIALGSAHTLRTLVLNMADEECGRTLVWASYHGHERLVEALLEREDAGTWIDRPSDECAGAPPPIVAAATMAHPRCVYHLLRAGAKTMAEDSTGNDALVHVVRGLCVLRMHCGTDCSLLRQQHVRTLRTIIAHGHVERSPLLDGVRGYGWTPLMQAASYPRSARVIDRLLRLGADPNGAGHGGATPLMLATDTGDMSLVRMLLRGGADVSIRDCEGRAALDIARAQRRANVVFLLTHSP